MTLPRISIVTPSYNQGQFIEETIKSVIDQDYPDIEYIVMDGGSKDETVDVLKKYSDRIAFWVSEKDEGQTDAINKGFERATGEICAYINSDDVYLPGAFRAIAESYVQQKWAWCYSPILVGQSITKSERWEIHDFEAEEFYVQQLFGQQGVFWRKDVLPKPYFRKEFRYAMDADFFSRVLLSKQMPAKVHFTTGFFRLHEQSKTSQIDHVLAVEGRRLYRDIFNRLDANGKQRLIQARRQKAIRQLSARIERPEFNQRKMRRIKLSLTMLNNSRKSITFRMGVSQLLRSLKKLMF